MHLLCITTKGEVGLRYVIDTSDVKYAILSHRWGDDEVLFADLKLPGWTSKAGARKIEYCMRQARSDGLQYSWVDTCCINKDSSAELSEAINSMYRWYEASAKCYVYLDDVRKPEDFARSQWFTRGWTLQELIAPRDVVFYDHGWCSIGTRSSRQQEISSITKIPESVLRSRHQAKSFSVAQRFSWAAGRKTTRREDSAYSLLGLLDINMPLLYGEGDNAVMRLQEEIIRSSSDQSILCWRVLYDPYSSGVLAPTLECFRHCAKIAYQYDPSRQTMTNVGLEIQLRTTLLPRKRHQICLAELSCFDEDGDQLALVLGRANANLDQHPVLIPHAGWRTVKRPSTARGISFAPQTIMIANHEPVKDIIEGLSLFASANLSVVKCWPQFFRFWHASGAWEEHTVRANSVACGFVLELKDLDGGKTGVCVMVTIAVVAFEERILAAEIRSTWGVGADALGRTCARTMTELLYRLVKARGRFRRLPRVREPIWHTSTNAGGQELVVALQSKRNGYGRVGMQMYCCVGPASGRDRYANWAFARSQVGTPGAVSIPISSQLWLLVSTNGWHLLWFLGPVTALVYVLLAYLYYGRAVQT